LGYFSYPRGLNIEDCRLNICGILSILTFFNELPCGKLRSIGAKTTGVAPSEAGYIPLLWRTPLSDICQDMQYVIAKQKHCGFYGCIDSCSRNTITQFSEQAAGN